MCVLVSSISVIWHGPSLEDLCGICSSCDLLSVMMSSNTLIE